VDVVRSCYGAKFKFFRDSSILTDVQWYFVPNDTPIIPFPIAFYSRVWEREDNLSPPIGEQNSPVPWKGGKSPGVTSTGGLCGSEAQWGIGSLTSDPVPSRHAGSLSLACCDSPPIVAFGGTATGGVSQENFCCTFFPNPYVPARVYFHVTGPIPPEVFPLDWDVPFSGAWSNLDYLCTMMASNDCQTWNFLQFPPPWPAADPLFCDPLLFGFSNVRIVHPVHGVVFVDGYVSAEE